jgi:hypothetical protein
MIARAATAGVIAVSLSALAGCVSRASVIEASCAPVRGALAAGAHADGLAGEFQLTLVATTGPRSGHAVSGHLWLELYGGAVTYPTPAAGQPGSDAVYPLHGRAEIRPDLVGATVPGDIRSSDGSQPGVLVIEWDQPASTPSREITLRFGSLANLPGNRPIDGAYAALFLVSISSERFAGRWESGVSGMTAGGYFCAERTSVRQ